MARKEGRRNWAEREQKAKKGGNEFWTKLQEKKKAKWLARKVRVTKLAAGTLIPKPVPNRQRRLHIIYGVKRVSGSPRGGPSVCTDHPSSRLWSPLPSLPTRFAQMTARCERDAEEPSQRGREETGYREHDTRTDREDDRVDTEQGGIAVGGAEPEIA